MNPRRGDGSVDVAHEGPRAVVCLVTCATAGWGCKALGEITADDRERADELSAVLGELAREVGDRRRGGDHGAKRGMMLERVGRAFLHARVLFTRQTRSPSCNAARLSRRVRVVRPPTGHAVRNACSRIRVSSGVAGRSRASTLFNLGALAFGAIGLVIVIDQLGGEGFRRVFLGVGRWFVVIAAIDVVSAMCDAVGIHGFLLGKAPYLRVFAAQISGLAINRLTPGNSLGEPVKVTMLVRTVPTDAAVSAIVMYNLTTMYVAITTIALGVPLTAVLLDLPHRIAVIVWVGLAGLVAVAIAVALLVRRGALTTFIDVLARANAIGAQAAERWRARVDRKSVV